MNITIITGGKGSGKTTYLSNLLKNNYFGVITKCVDRNEKKYYFELINKNRYLLCCYYDNGMKFNKYNFDIIKKHLMENNKQKNIVIDEIGWLELEEKGLFNTLNSILLLRSVENLYISMRYDIYRKLIEKFNIIDYKLVKLSKIK